MFSYIDVTLLDSTRIFWTTSEFSFPLKLQNNKIHISQFTGASLLQFKGTKIFFNFNLILILILVLDLAVCIYRLCICIYSSWY